FARILSSIGESGKAGHAVVYDDTPIGLHAEDIMDRILRDGPMTLQQVFAGRTRRVEMIGLFLATLELVRLKKVKIVQDTAGGDIELHPRPVEEQLGDQDSANVDWRDPQTGEVQYEWADEASKKRADRRVRLRALAAERLKAGEAAQVDAEEDEDDEADEEGDEAVQAVDETGDAASDLNSAEQPESQEMLDATADADEDVDED